MPRVAKGFVYSAIDRAAQHIRDAAASDGIASRKDLEAKLGQLDGTERELTQRMVGLIESLDRAPGSRVTDKDVDKAVAWARQNHVDKHDLNRNGLSRAELSQLSGVGRLAFKLARELEAAQAPLANSLADFDAASTEQKLMVLFGLPNIEPYWGRSLELQPGFELEPVVDFRVVVDAAAGEARDALDRFDWTTADAHDANEYNSGEELELSYRAIVKDGSVYGYAATSQAPGDPGLRDDAMICDRHGAWLTDAL